MKRLTLSTLAFLSFGVTNTAFAAHFYIFSDPSFSSMEAFDETPGTLTVYVMHYPPPPDNVGFQSVGSDFFLVPDGFTGVWLSDEALYPGGSGSSQTGWFTPYTLEIGVGGPLVAVTYMTFGTSAPDSHLKFSSIIGPYPATWEFGGYLQPAVGHDLLINPSPTPVNPSTWGAVKALYH